MARPQSPDYDKRRDLIVDAAARLYARRGFQGTSISDLANACHTSKSLIYHYFKSKDEILVAAMAGHLEDLEVAAESAVTERSPKDRIMKLVHSFMKLYIGAQERHKVLLNELDNLPRQARKRIVNKQRKILELVCGILQELNPADKRDKLPTAMLLFGMINWTHTWFDPEGEMSSDQLADLAVEIFLSGVSSRQAS
jgi:AcrR family transcriptional regulator